MTSELETRPAARSHLRRRWGTAWIALCVAVALHVIDEATTGFLDLWNLTVESLRRDNPWLPLPTFDFNTWLVGLAVAIAILFGLSWWVFRGARWMRPLC